MPDTLVGGIAKILLGKGPMKEASFLDVMPAMEVSSPFYVLLQFIKNSQVYGEINSFNFFTPILLTG